MNKTSLSKNDIYLFRVPKEREKNNYRFLIGFLVHIFHFKNAHYNNINRSFKA